MNSRRDNTKRRRLRLKKKFRISGMVLIAVISAVMFGSSLFGINDASSLTLQEYKCIEVQTGDTLWDIADEYMPEDMDPRKAVYIITEENNLEQKTLYPGQILNIPQYI